MMPHSADRPPATEQGDDAMDVKQAALEARLRAFGDGVCSSAQFDAQVRARLLAEAARRHGRRRPRQARPAWLRRLPSVLLALVALASGLAAARIVPQTAGSHSPAGPVLRTLRLGPGAAVIDEQAHHLFVATTGSFDTKTQRYTSPSTLTMIDTGSGAILRTIPLSTPVQWPMIVDARAGRLFLTTSPVFNTRTPGQLYVLDSHSGAIVRRLPLSLSSSTLLLADLQAGHVFVYDSQEVAPSGQLAMQSAAWRMLDAATGKVLGRVSLPLHLDPHDKEADGGRGLRSWAVDERLHRAYLCLQARTESVVVVVDTRTGQTVRIMPTGEQDLQVAVDEQTGHVFLAGMAQDFTHYYFDDSNLKVLDAVSGATLRTIDLQRAALVSLVSDQRTHHVYLASAGTYNRHENLIRKGRLVVLDSARGDPVASLAITSPNFLQLVAPLSRLFVVDSGPLNAQYQQLGRSSLKVIDTRTNRVVRTVPLAGILGIIGLDQGTGHLFVESVPPFDKKGYPTGTATVMMVAPAAWP